MESTRERGTHGTGSGLLGPVMLRPVFQERIWGTQALGPWYSPPGEGKPIGEVWLTAETCEVGGGPMAGSILRDVVKAFPHALGGGSEGQFPLLIKMLYPREKLSVQVHPDDREAQAMGELRGKTECWYVLDAEPGAEIALGFQDGVVHGELRESIVQARLESKLRYVPVKARDMVFVDAGTVHAIGPGMTVLETQQYNDVTFRLYDYGRPRELHVDSGLAVTKMQTAAGIVPPRDMGDFVRLVESPYFIVDRWQVAPGGKVHLEKIDRMQILVALGRGSRLTADGNPLVVDLPPGVAVVLPAENVAYSLAAAEPLEVVRIAEGKA